MPELVRIAETIEVPHARTALWPILSQTDWLNRAVGMPPVKYDVEPRAEGGSKVTARARAFGMLLTWHEYPFEWTEPKFYQVHRVFQSGPLAEAVMGMRLLEIATGTAIEIFADFTPRNAMGEFLVRHVIGPKTLSDMRGLVQHVSAHLAGQQKTVMPSLPVSGVNAYLLELGLEKLRVLEVSSDLRVRLKELLTESPDMELSHIRPFAMARRWQTERWNTLRAFLHATRAGLLNLRWEVLCPNCRATRLPANNSLKDLSRLAHCEVCNIKFDAEFDKSVELKFSVHPSVRPFEEQTFCLAGPGGRPHVVSQLYVEPGKQRQWDVPDLGPNLRLRSSQVKTPLLLPAVDMEIICQADSFELSAGSARSQNPKVSVTNPNSFPVLLSLEETAWDDEILTAARVTNWQEFRDLFAAEVISPTEQIIVGSQVILFTDLRGSTAMYTRIGDAPVYALVRDHFKILHDVLTEHHGTLVKTIGDAVMAVFTTLPEALAAVRQMHSELAQANLKQSTKLHLKSSLHTGPCLAVNANDRLDYFGSTVNFAARLIEHATGDDLVIADEIYRRSETQKFLADIGRSGVSGEERFTGFPDAVKVWSIPVLVA